MMNNPQPPPSALIQSALQLNLIPVSSIFAENNMGEGSATIPDAVTLSSINDHIEASVATVFDSTTEVMRLIPDNEGGDNDRGKCPVPFCDGRLTSHMYYIEDRGYVVRWECGRCDHARVI